MGEDGQGKTEGSGHPVGDRETGIWKQRRREKVRVTEKWGWGIRQE